MTRKSRWVCAFAVLVCLLGLPLAGSAANPQLSSEVQVNTNDLAQLHNPAAAFDGAGHSLVVWENDLLGVRGRLYDATGHPLGSELSLVANVAWSVLPGIAPIVFHQNPAVVFLPSGNFLLAWAEERGILEWQVYFENLQIESREILVQEFNVSGKPIGAAHTLSSGGSGLKSQPRLAALPAGGGAVATWMSSYGSGTTPASELGVFTRQLDGTGRPIGSQTQVDTKSGAIGLAPALAVDPDGSYLIAWTSENGTDTFNTSIYARVFAASGAPLAAPFAITSNTTGPQERVTVANDGQGSYLVAWQSYFNDIWHSRVDGQIVSKAGGLLGKRQTISNGGGQNWAEVAPSAAVAPGGTFMLTWMEYNTWFPVGLAGVPVDRTGVAVGSQFWINNLQIGSQYRTSLATDGAGHYVSSYEGFQNQTTLGIMARYFAAD